MSHDSGKELRFNDGAQRPEELGAMSSEQERHLLELKRDITSLLNGRYRTGAKEHGGNIWDLSTDELFDELDSEIIDALVYARTLRERVKALQGRI